MSRDGDQFVLSVHRQFLSTSCVYVAGCRKDLQASPMRPEGIRWRKRRNHAGTAMEGIYPGLGCQRLAKAYGRTRGASVFGLHDASKINQREGDLGTPGPA